MLRAVLCLLACVTCAIYGRHIERSASFRSIPQASSRAITSLLLKGTLSNSLRVTRREVALAATLATAFRLPRPSAAVVDPSLVDEQGRFVVDPAKATNGLLDPLSEPTGAYSTIGAALAMVPTGGTIVVRPGTYTERLIINRQVTILADNGAILSWKSDKPYEAALTVDLNEAGTSKGNVKVTGLQIQHYSPSIAQNYAVYIRESEGRGRVELRECDVSSSSGSGVGVEGGDVTLVGCRVHDCKNHGVLYVGQGATGSVHDCVVEKCKLNGVLLRDGASPTLQANVLRGNSQYGASLIDCRGSYLDTNQAVDNGKGAVQGECDMFD